MRDLINHKTIPDDKVWLYDGIVYIISRQKLTTKFSLDVIYLDAEYNEPLCLVEIAEKYPEVCKVIFESWRHGDIFTYKNHDGETWELTGTTIGFV